MPFDLTYVKRPTIEPRANLPPDVRGRLRKAIGQHLIDRAARVVDAGAEPGARSDLIWLNPSGLLEDLKHDWLAEPVVRLLDVVRAVADLDVFDNEKVGSDLRGQILTLVADAEDVGDLVSFIDLFEPSIVHTLIRPACVDALTLASALVRWMTDEDDAASAHWATLVDSKRDELPTHEIVLHGSPHADRVEAESSSVDALEEIEHLLGISLPAKGSRWIDTVRKLEAEGHDLCELGSRQLRYVGPYRASERIWARNFLSLGIRVGRSAYPLLAHRGAFLSWRLFEQAAHKNDVVTLATLHELFDEESLWMIESQLDYLGAIERYRAGDEAAIVEAYGDLAEGTLRRYGSLVVAFERICAGVPPQRPLVFGTVNDVEAQLGVYGRRPLPWLLLRFVERKLRNADAHANVVVEVGGALRVRQRDGSTESVEPNQVYGRTAGLRSLLDGVDIALNHASIQDIERQNLDPSTMAMPPMSHHTFEHVIGEFAAEHTPGWISSVNWREDVLTLTYHGPPATYDQLQTFANSLTRLLGPKLPSIRVLNEAGEPNRDLQAATQSRSSWPERSLSLW